MLINGYTVDRSLPAFRKLFFLPDILKELDKEVVILKWANDMRSLPHPPQATKDRLDKLVSALNDFFDAEKCGGNWKIDQATYFAHNAGLQKKLLDWEQKADHKMKARYACAAYIILELMEIAEYTATEQDASDCLEYLQEQNFFPVRHPDPAHHTLKIKLHNGKNPKLYYEGQIVADLPEAKNYPSRGFATVAEHPATGYVGITKDGNLVNCSAFVIPPLKMRPVKVLLNQLYYVILQEDGSLIHNLRFCAELPTVPVRDVILNKDQVQWVPM